MFYLYININNKMILCTQFEMLDHKGAKKHEQI